MSNILVAAGDKMSLLERLAAAQITVTDEDTNYPKAGLSDREGSNPSRFLTAGANRAITIDGDLLQVQGEMEGAGTLPPGWTSRSTGTGSAVRSTANPQGGSVAHIRVNGGAAGVGAASIDFTARAGERLRIFSCWLNSNGTLSGGLRLRNLKTGKYATSGSAWQASAAFALTGNQATYTNLGGSYEIVVEDYLTCRSDLVTIRLTLETSANGNIDFDNVAIGIMVDLLVAHGHNIDPSITYTWEHADTVSGSYSSVATPIVYQPSFYSAPTASTKRVQRVTLTGTNTEIPWHGELILTQKLALARTPNYPLKIIRKREFIRQQTAIGEERLYALDDTPTRVWTAPYSLRSSAQMKEYRDAIFLRGGLGEHPMVIVPQDDDPEVVLYGRIASPEFMLSQGFVAVWDTDDLAIAEMAFPTWVQ